MIELPTVLSLGSFLNMTLLIFILGITTGVIGMMFQYFMMPNMILFPYAILLSKIASKGEIWRHLMRPLGRCRYCNSIWICMYAYIYIIGFNPLILFAFAFNFLTVYAFSNYIMPNLDPSAEADKTTKVVFGYKNTPWQAMLKTYAIMGFGYAIIYGIIPLIV